MILAELASCLKSDRNGMIFVILVAVIAFLATSSRRSARRCPRCREMNRAAAVFCAQCGHRLPKR